MVVAHETPAVQEVIALVHERDELLARLSVIDQSLVKAVTDGSPLLRVPTLTQTPVVKRLSAKPSTRVAKGSTERQCGKCGGTGHNARTCGRAPKKPRATKDDSEPEPARRVAGLSPERAALAAEHVGMVEKVAIRLKRRLPAHIEINELMSSGTLGLMDAAERFDPARGKRFEAFAEFRIRGAMLDGLRESDSLSRDMRRRSNELREAARQLESQLGRAPGPDEIARHLGIGVDELYERQRECASGSTVVGIDDAGPDLLERVAGNTFEDPFDVTARHETTDALVSAIEALPRKARKVMSLLYVDGMIMKDIGAVMGVTESRVCQIHAEAVVLLRETMGGAGAEMAA